MESRVGDLKSNAGKARVLLLERIGKIEIVIGTGLCIFGVASFICDVMFRWRGFDLSNLIAKWLVVVLSVVIGLLGIGSGIHYLCRVRHFRRYVSVLQHDETGSVRRLADSMGEPYDETLDRIHRYAGRGLFGNIIIDDVSGRISFPDRIRKYSDSGYRTIICLGCGATRSLPDNTVVRCEYCGNIINTTLRK